MIPKPDHPHVVIIQNTELGSHLPLSVYLTGLVRNFARLENSPKVIVSSVSLSLDAFPGEKKFFKTKTNLYSVFGNVVFGFKALRFLFAINRTKKVEVIHALYPSSSLFAGVLFKLFHWDVKIIYDVRSPWIEMAIERSYISKYLRYVFLFCAYSVEWILCRFVARFVFISDGLKDLYIKRMHIKPDITSVIPSGVDVQNFAFNGERTIRKKLGFSDSDKVIGYVGGLALERNLDFLINVFSMLKTSDDNYHLLIIGDGPARGILTKLVHDKNIQERVTFTGNIEHKDIPEYMKTFDIGVCHLPDLFIYRQSFPLKILEYAACGIPIVASNISAHREIQKQLKEIYIYDMNPESFVKTVTSIMTTAPFLGNKEKLRNTYDWSALSRRYLDLYESV